jgi:predicted aminopeptidase
VLACLALAGCETLGYYTQAVRGQLQLTFARQPVARLLDSEQVDADLKARLARSQTLLAFVNDHLGLAAEGRYRSYVDLGREAVLYNLVATPALSLDAHHWCYPVAGCAPYRGYFRQAAARRAADRFAARGYTVYLGAVPAYSTLGWFRDPLLSSFIRWPDADLLSLLAHELSHSRVWVDGDVAYNEAFATFVGEQAVRAWFAAKPGGAAALARWQQERAGWRRLQPLLNDLAATLRRAYGTDAVAAAKAAARDQLYEAFRACYAKYQPLLGAGRYDRYVEAINDAALAARATYANRVPAFAMLFRDVGAAWPAFFERAQALGDLPSAQREEQVRELLARAAARGPSAQEQVAQGADDQHAQQVQCQALTNHAIDGDLAGAEDDDVGGRGDR